jgi:hypothetical protein
VNNCSVPRCYSDGITSRRMSPNKSATSAQKSFFMSSSTPCNLHHEHESIVLRPVQPRNQCHAGAKQKAPRMILIVNIWKYPRLFSCEWSTFRRLPPGTTKGSRVRSSSATAATTAISTSSAIPTTATAATARVASHLSETRFDVLLGLLQHGEKVTSLLGICDVLVQSLNEGR